MKIKIEKSKVEYYSMPFDHWIIDNFFDIETARNLSKEFISYDSDECVHYNTWISEKKACNQWDKFPPLTYKTFFYLLSPEFSSELSELTGIKPIYSDIGLHGGGWHMHGKGGNLSIHLDYSIHPKLNLQRKLNLIVYLEEDYLSEWGGSLQLWSHNYDTDKPLKSEKEIAPLFNRAILFDTTQKSWHGFPEKINPLDGKLRKSFGVYYLTDINSTAETRYKAHYERI